MASDANLTIQCDCGSPEHMLMFDVWHWSDDRNPHSEMVFHFQVDSRAPVWRRFVHAARYLLTGSTKKWWWADTVFAEPDVVRLRDFLNDYLSASLNGGDA